MRSLFLIAALGGVAGATPIEDVQKFYAKAPQLTATFRQTVTYAAFGRTEKSDGTIRIAKPVKLRADYVGKDKKIQKTFVFDGKSAAYVNHVNKSIAKGVANALPMAVVFLTGGDLTKDFAIAASESYGGSIELVPKTKTAEAKSIYLVVAKDGHVTRSIVVDTKGDSNDFSFYSPDTTTKIDDKMFVVP